MELEKNTTLKIESAEISHETTIFAEPVYHYKNFLITNALLTSWVVVIVIIIVSFILRSKLQEIPGKIQNLFDIMAVLGANIFGVFSIGIWKTFNKYVNLNVIGQIVKKIRKDPTIIIVAPITFFVGLIEIIGEFAKIASLSFRLFGNVFAGEVLLVSMAALVGYIIPIPFLFLEILVGLIQALIFSILLVVYFTIGATDHDEHEEKSSSPSQDGHEVVIIN